MSDLSNSDRAVMARREWDLKGRPDMVRDINKLLTAGEEVPESLLNTSNVKPRVNADDPNAYSPPPRKGKGSGHDAWAEFAATTTDMESDVLEALSRDDIIESLETRGVIEKEG